MELISTVQVNFNYEGLWNELSFYGFTAIFNSKINIFPFNQQYILRLVTVTSWVAITINDYGKSDIKSCSFFTPTIF